MYAAIDFGNSNTDAVVERGGALRHWSMASQGKPTVAMVEQVLAVGGVALDEVTHLAVTGGHHRTLPKRLNKMQIIPINEVDAIALGGQVLSGLPQLTPMLVVSGGSGVAMIAAHGTQVQHVTGSGVGGGALLGLSHLLIDTADPLEIDALALAGDTNGVDLTLPDVVSGPIGSLPPDTTAVNFGRILRLAQLGQSANREDLAAAIVTLVGQVVGTIGVNAARAIGVEQVVVTGHLTDMRSIRAAIERTGSFFGLPFIMPENAGQATALGALRSLPPRSM